MTENKNNPLLCNPETGVCEIPETEMNNNYKNRIYSG